MANPYLELTGPSYSVSCKPVVAGGATEKWWRSKAGTGRYVMTDVTSAASGGSGLLPILLVTPDEAKIYGRLESVQGTGDRFTATVMILGADMWALGDSTSNASITAAEIGETLKGAGDGKLKIASGGSGRLVGGNKTDKRIALDGMHNLK